MNKKTIVFGMVGIVVGVGSALAASFALDSFALNMAEKHYARDLASLEQAKKNELDSFCDLSKLKSELKIKFSGVDSYKRYRSECFKITDELNGFLMAK